MPQRPSVTFTPQRLAAWAGVALAVMGVLWLLAPVLAPFGVAAMLAYALHPMVRRLQGVTTDAQARQRLEELMLAWQAKPYRNFVRQHLSAWVRGEQALAFQKGGFCSELVAEVYRQWRLLPPDLPARHYVPRDFASEAGVPLLKGGLSPACLLAV